MDVLRIQVLEDGTLKCDNDGISQPNHSNAEGFYREMSRLAGGKTEIKMKNASLHSALAAHCHDGHTHSH